MKETVLKRYKVRQNILKLSNQMSELKNAEKALDNIITYKALVLDDPSEAQRFRKKYIDSRKEGMFKIRAKNGLNIDIPKIT